MNETLVRLLNPLSPPLKQPLADNIGYQIAHSHGSFRQYIINYSPKWRSELTNALIGLARGSVIGAAIGAGLAAFTGNDVLRAAEASMGLGAAIDAVQFIIRGDLQIISGWHKAHFSGCSDMCPYSEWNSTDPIIIYFKRELGLN